MSESKDNGGQRGLPAAKVKIKENIDIFKCPICGEKMYSDDLKSIICLNNHCFDIAKKGYINLLRKPNKSRYDKELFAARSFICENGFFNPLTDCLADLIALHVGRLQADDVRILDAGCGEGYHLSRIMRKLPEKADAHFQGVGIDIAKEGIQIASKHDKDIIWCVADLAAVPFMDKKFAAVLNILSPSNYREFDRIIAHDGILIKVVPGGGYLQELRNVFYQQTDREVYSNEQVIELFKKNFQLTEMQNVRYNAAINKEELAYLIKMTPLSWGITEDKIQKVLNQDIDNITADFTVIVGKSRQ